MAATAICCGLNLPLGQALARLLECKTQLAATIKGRLPYVEPLNHLQIELIRRQRGEANPKMEEGC